MPQQKKPLEIDSVDALLEELKQIAPEGQGPGFYSTIAINNSNIWRIVEELKALQDGYEKLRKGLAYYARSLDASDAGGVVELWSDHDNYGDRARKTLDELNLSYEEDNG